MKVFKEEQRFTQLWLMIVLGFSILVPVIIITVELTKGYQKDLLIALGVVILSPLIIFLFKLSTRIDEKGIHYKFFPFHLKFRTIQWHELKKAHVRNYDAISEYGGWGLKGGRLWNKSNGIAINVKGDVGIQLEGTDGKKILIGTQNKEQAKRALTTYNHKINNG